MDTVRSTEVQLAVAEYIEERSRWVDELGSDRLKLAKKLGFLKESDNVYREERRNLEKKGWLLANEMPLGFHTSSIHNPSLAALQELERYLETDPDVSLTYVQWKEEEDRRVAETTWQRVASRISRGREALMSKWLGLTVYRWIGLGR